MPGAKASGGVWGVARGRAQCGQCYLRNEDGCPGNGREPGKQAHGGHWGCLGSLASTLSEVRHYD